ncbi:MAG: hypothetical protein MET45_29735 [Nostoc sp. LLA-1]|nr:hypothetical protein [Cyanocohniella sp. LLY]
MITLLGNLCPQLTGGYVLFWHYKMRWAYAPQEAIAYSEHLCDRLQHP